MNMLIELRAKIDNLVANGEDWQLSLFLSREGNALLDVADSADKCVKDDDEKSIHLRPLDEALARLRAIGQKG